MSTLKKINIGGKIYDLESSESSNKAELVFATSYYNEGMLSPWTIDFPTDVSLKDKEFYLIRIRSTETAEEYQFSFVFYGSNLNIPFVFEDDREEKCLFNCVIKSNSVVFENFFYQGAAEEIQMSLYKLPYTL